MPKTAESLEARFFAQTEAGADGCLIWTSFRNSYGYGKMSVNGAKCFAHRVAYELFVGPIPAGLVIDHLCRNRACVNVEHMEPVTPWENTARGEAGRNHAEKTQCIRDHIFPAGVRICQPCRRINERVRRAALKELI